MNLKEFTMLLLTESVCLVALSGPTAIMAMTVLTPMMFPSIVKADLILIAVRALNAIRKLAKIVVMFSVFLSSPIRESQRI
jgi:hypothetical protein